jgi:hypothetical protein
MTSDRSEKKDDLQKHYRSACNRTGFCTLARNIWFCSKDG